MHFARNLTWLRQKSALFPAEIAARLSISEIRYREYETSEAEPTLAELLNISKYWDVSLDDLLASDLEARQNNFQQKDIRLLVLDVDGVLTDGGMYFGESGEEMKKFNTKDGRAVINLVRAGVEVAICSGGIRPTAIQARADRLKVSKVYVGTAPKTGIVEGWITEMGIGWEQVAYIGDDVNDLAVIEKAGLTACPSDAVRIVRQSVDVILRHRGGHGAVREFVEDFLLDIV